MENEKKMLSGKLCLGNCTFWQGSPGEGFEMWGCFDDWKLEKF
jgi:hypothetical protein